MADAIQMPTPKVLSIINDGNPKPQTTTPLLAPVTHISGSIGPAKAEIVPVPKAADAVSHPKAKSLKTDVAETVAMVPFAIRIRSDLVQELFKTSSARKLKKIRPYTQQDILAEALSDWLKNKED